MKHILSTILLVSIFTNVNAEIYEKSVTVVCGSQKDLEKTIKKYREKPVVASVHVTDTTVLTVYGNLETGTSTWVSYVPSLKEYCVFGSGNKLMTTATPKINTVVYK